VSDQTVGNILRRHGIAPAPKRSRTTTWTDFIHRHRAVLAGTDFFTVEVLTWRGLVTWYCSSSTWTAAWLLSAVSPSTRTKSGCSKWPVTPLWARGASEWMPVRFARPGHEVLSIVPGDVGSGRSKMPAVASAESEPERICREMGTLGEAGVPVTVDSVWRSLAQASSPAIHGTLPCGAEP